MWILYAFLSALTAALVAIFAKLGLREVDPTLATTLRSLIMAAFLVIVTWSLGKFHGFSLETLNGKEWILLSLAGIAGALSWLFYFFALKDGTASAVVAIDQLSIVFVVILAAIFLTETAGWRTTARKMSRLLEQIHNGEVASRAHCDEMLAILLGQFSESRLPRYIMFRASVAHKTGDWPPLTGNDAGIITGQGGPIVISVFAAQNRGPFYDLEDTEGKIAEMLLDAWQ